MSSTESRVIEYRLVWPNGEVYTTATKATIDELQDDLSLKLGNAGVPREYMPRREARILVTMATDWAPYRDVEASFDSDVEEEMEPISPARPWKVRIS